MSLLPTIRSIHNELFGDEWKVDFEMFSRQCFKILERVRERKGGSFHMLARMRSVLSLLSELLYERRLSEYTPLSRLMRASRRTLRIRPRMEDIWDPAMVFNYYRQQPPNEALPLKELTIKGILLLLLMTLCRPYELSTINMQESRRSEKGYELAVNLKTSVQRSIIPVPKQKPEDESICPVLCIDALWKIASRDYRQEKTFLLNTRTHKPLTAVGIRKLTEEGLQLIGIPERFSAYSTKHAAISNLLQKGVPEAIVARHARLSTRSHTATNHYLRMGSSAGIIETLIADPGTPPGPNAADDTVMEEEIAQL